MATGSRPTHYAGVPFDDPDVYDSDQIYSLRRVPKDVVVVGGGPVGVEFATVLTVIGIPATRVSQPPGDNLTQPAAGVGVGGRLVGLSERTTPAPCGLPAAPFLTAAIPVVLLTGRARGALRW